MSQFGTSNRLSAVTEFEGIARYSLPTHDRQFHMMERLVSNVSTMIVNGSKHTWTSVADFDCGVISSEPLTFYVRNVADVWHSVYQSVWDAAMHAHCCPKLHLGSFCNETPYVHYICDDDLLVVLDRRVQEAFWPFLVDLPADALSFARRENLMSSLAIAHRIIGETFTDVQSVSCSLVTLSDSEDETQQLVIDVVVNGSIEQVLSQKRDFTQRWVESAEPSALDKIRVLYKFAN